MLNDQFHLKLCNISRNILGRNLFLYSKHNDYDIEQKILGTKYCPTTNIMKHYVPRKGAKAPGIAICWSEIH